MRLKHPLITKLLAINVAVIAVAIVCVWLAIDYLAADYFSTLMEQYHISPVDTHGMFLTSVHRYLLAASLVATCAAIGLSYLLTRRVLRPLSEMSALVTALAAGDYEARVNVRGNDEISRLGRNFNRMADSLQHLEQLRRDMVVDVAHELRTPLTNVRGYLEAMQDGVMLLDAETLELLHEEVLRLIQLVEDLQQLARADAAKWHLQRVDICVPDLLDKVIRLYQPQFAQKKIQVRVSVAADAQRVTADPDKLLQVVSNLLSNACRYAPRASVVRITAASAAGEVRLSVENAADRIPERELALLFERLYRPDRSRSRDRGGAGIGLAIVKQLAEAHGGRAGAQNSAAGVKFWVSLPC